MRTCIVLAGACAVCCESAPGSQAAATGDTRWPLPPRGWNSWFAADVHNNETLMRSNADALISLGLAALGFTNVNLDGGWQGGRSPNGTVYANSTLFPSGMPALSSYLTSRGLSLGMYTDRGGETCDGHVGSASFETQDAQLYASWNASYLKEDSCFATMSHTGAMAQFARMQDALTATGVPMFFSLCGWLKWYPGLAGPAGVGQSWRIGPDALSWDNVLMNIDAAADAAPFVGPGRFADVDEIMGPSRGRPISRAQTRTQLAVIAVVGSPLLLSFDLTGRTREDPDVADYLNGEVLDVHQDPLAGGPVFARLSGGYVSSDRLTPLTRLPCDATDSRQVWSLQPALPPHALPGKQPSGLHALPGKQPSGLHALPGTDGKQPRAEGGGGAVQSGFLVSSGAPGMCLYVGAAWTGECNNGQQIWLAQCGGRLCCNPGCTSQQFAFNGTDGTLRSLYAGSNMSSAGPYATLDPVPNAVFLQERFNSSDPLAPAQQWRFDAATGLVSTPAEGGSCMGAAPRDDRNVWGRKLHDGAWALLFVNFNKTAAQSVACDATCFSRAGFPAAQTFSVRDLWAHTENGTATASSGYSVSLPPDGTSALLKFTPVATLS